MTPQHRRAELAARDAVDPAVAALRDRCCEPSRAAAIRILMYAAVLAVPLTVSAIVPAAGEQEPHTFLELLADNVGLLGFTIVCLQFVIAARFPWVEWPFGLDMLFRFHRAMAMVASGLLIVHPTLMVLDGETDLVRTLHVKWPIQLGRLTLLVLLALVTVSLGWRAMRLRFEQWRMVHNLLAFGLLASASIHSLFAGDDLQTWPMRAVWGALIAAAVAAYAHHKLLWRRHGHGWYEVSEVVPEAHDTWTLVLRPAGQDVAAPYLPGQFHFITLYRAGMAPEEHPFTISSSPAERHVVASTIKASGDFTQTIRHTKAGDRALVRGPYGRFSHLLQPRAPRLVFIAGGVGITPFMSMLRYMRDTSEWQPTVLLYANKTERDILFRVELQTLEAQSERHLHVVHLLSRADDHWPGERGRLDAARLERYAGPSLDENHFYVCGPPPMIQSTVALLHEMGVDDARIHLEVFAL